MSDIGTLNKQCRQCHTPKNDGEYTESFGYVVCDDCKNSVKTSKLIGVMWATSYHPERIAAGVAMVQELEKELETAKREAAYWKADNEKLKVENGRLWYAVESARNGLVSAGMENATTKKRLHKNLAAIVRMVENDDTDMQIIGSCIVAIADTGGEYKRGNA